MVIRRNLDKPKKTPPQADNTIRNQDHEQGDELREIQSPSENTTQNQVHEQENNSEVIQVISFMLHG